MFESSSWCGCPAGVVAVGWEEGIVLRGKHAEGVDGWPAADVGGGPMRRRGGLAEGSGVVTEVGMDLREEKE